MGQNQWLYNHQLLRHRLHRRRRRQRSKRLDHRRRRPCSRCRVLRHRLHGVSQVLAGPKTAKPFQLQRGRGWARTLARVPDGRRVRKHGCPQVRRREALPILPSRGGLSRGRFKRFHVLGVLRIPSFGQTSPVAVSVPAGRLAQVPGRGGLIRHSQPV